MGTLTITRTNQFFNRIRKIQIYIDGSRFYKIANGETKSFELPDGKHQLYVKVDWMKSHSVTVVVEQGKRKSIELASPVNSDNSGGWGLLSLLFIIILARFSQRYHNDLIVLIPVCIMMVALVYFFFFSKSKSALYYMFIKPHDVFYLKEV